MNALQIAALQYEWPRGMEHLHGPDIEYIDYCDVGLGQRWKFERFDGVILHTACVDSIQIIDIGNGRKNVFIRLVKAENVLPHRFMVPNVVKCVQIR